VSHLELRDKFKQLIPALQEPAESWNPQQIIQWAFESFGRHIAISSAFGAAGMVIIDMTARLRGSDFRLFTLDTQFLFPETYHLMQRVEQKYGIAIERVSAPQSPAEQERKYGESLWSRNPDLCCKIRKVEPLRQKLEGLAAWITSIRREQTTNRAGAHKIEFDAKFGLIKVNPIADWTDKQVWQYIHDYQVPYNPLHDQDYPSIGCTHCTRPVLPGEDQRAGRWAGFAKKECGLHVIESAPQE
jgi:phosphoadenosine phosphosulfate reductase